MNGNALIRKEDEEIINVGQHLGHKAADNDGEIMEKMVQLENESTKALSVFRFCLFSF